jgi:Ca2+-dependent lipid-binding protein
MDPYVVMQLGMVRQRTEVQLQGGTAPMWDQAFVFPVTDAKEMTGLLDLTCYDQELRKDSDDFVGDGAVDLSLLLDRKHAASTEIDDQVKPRPPARPPRAHSSHANAGTH